MSERTDSSIDVSSHPVNQSGSSSKEIADIDIFNNNQKDLFTCIESKDKDFTISDIEHAISKVMENNHYSMLFIYGPNAKYTDKEISIEQLFEKWKNEGFILAFVSYEELINAIKLIGTYLDRKKFIDIINSHLENIRAKQETVDNFQELIQ